MRDAPLCLMRVGNFRLTKFIKALNGAGLGRKRLRKRHVVFNCNIGTVF